MLNEIIKNKILCIAQFILHIFLESANPYIVTRSRLVVAVSLERVSDGEAGELRYLGLMDLFTILIVTTSWMDTLAQYIKV